MKKERFKELIDLQDKLRGGEIKPSEVVAALMTYVDGFAEQLNVYSEDVEGAEKRDMLDDRALLLRACELLAKAGSTLRAYEKKSGA